MREKNCLTQSRQGAKNEKFLSHTRSLHSLDLTGNTEHRTQMTQIAQIKTRSNQLHRPMIMNERKLPFMILRPRASRWLRIAPSRGLNEKKDISRRERTVKPEIGDQRSEIRGQRTKTVPLVHQRTKTILDPSVASVGSSAAGVRKKTLISHRVRRERRGKHGTF